MQILKTRIKFSHLLRCCNVCSSSCECGVFKFVHFDSITVLSILITLILPNAHWSSQCSRMTLQLSEAVSFGILIHCLKSSFDTLSNILPFSDLKESCLLGKYLNTLDFSNSSFTTIWRSFLEEAFECVVCTRSTPTPYQIGGWHSLVGPYSVRHEQWPFGSQWCDSSFTGTMNKLHM